MLPESLSCGHSGCELWAGCTQEAEYRLLIPVDVSIHTNNAFLSMAVRERTPKVAPIRAAAAKAAKDAGVPRLARAFIWSRAYLAPHHPSSGRKRSDLVDADAFTIFSKPIVDGWCSRWTALSAKAAVEAAAVELRAAQAVKLGKLPAEKKAVVAWMAEHTPTVSGGPDEDSACILPDDNGDHWEGINFLPARWDLTPGAVDHVRYLIQANPPSGWADFL